MGFTFLLKHYVFSHGKNIFFIDIKLNHLSVFCLKLCLSDCKKKIPYFIPDIERSFEGVLELQELVSLVVQE